MTYLKNQIEEPMKVFKKENGKWVLVFKGTNWEKGGKLPTNFLPKVKKSA